MKKAIKILLALAVTLGISLCLCSCVDLDAIRETRVSYTGENQTEVVFLDSTYKQLDKKILEYLSSYDLSDTAYATDDDVPLLLTSIFGEWVNYNSTDTRLIEIDGIYYCREDLYDYAVDLIEKNVFDYPCIKEYDWETDQSVIRMLDKSLIDTVDEIIQTVEPESIYPETYDIVTVMATDEKGLFMHSLFYVEKLENGYFISMDNLSEDISGYVVPKEYEAQFEDLFTEEDYFEDYDYYEDYEDYDSDDDFQVFI